MKYPEMRLPTNAALRNREGKANRQSNADMAATLTGVDEVGLYLELALTSRPRSTTVVEIRQSQTVYRPFQSRGRLGVGLLPPQCFLCGFASRLGAIGVDVLSALRDIRQNHHLR